MIPFVHLHLHSHYSTLDGLGKVDEIVKRAVEIGSPAVAVTDHGSISSLPELFAECEKAGIKPIPGCEFYVVDDVEGKKGERRIHLTVWAKSWKGVQNILSQLTAANKQFYHRPRLTWEQAMQFEECCIGTACTVGPLMCDDYEDRVVKLSSVYGEDLYLEIMPNVISEDGQDIQSIANNRAIEMSQKYVIKLIATNDAHYVRREDSFTHEILLAIQSGSTLKDPNRWKFGSDAFYMRDGAEMISACQSVGIHSSHTISAIANTIELANKINVEMPKFEVKLPSLYPDDAAVFQQKVMDGWNKLIVATGKVNQEYRERLVYEIGVINKLGFIRYFLIVEDIINWSRANGIMVGPGRGSAAGSLVCYLMGITQVDPIRFGLYFERFLNPERIDLPDIDVDFADNRRDEVFAYIKAKYGDDKVGRIGTFNAMQIAGAFRDVAKVYDVNLLTVNMLSKQIEDVESFEKVPELAKFKADNAALMEQVFKINGTIRSLGTHACGLVISSEPLVNTGAIEKHGDSETINWDKNVAEKFGLLKVDILGLSTLSILSKARDIIKVRRGVDIDFTSIPLDDQKTLELFRRGEGVGVFQFENCISGDAIVDGVKLKDLYVKNVYKSIRCLDESSMVIKKGRVKKVVYSGVQKVFKLKTKNGKELRLTEEHPVYVRGAGWVKLKDVKEGDEILTIRRKL